MKTHEMEENVKKLITRFNLLPNKSGMITMKYDFLSKDYELRGLSADEDNNGYNIETILFTTEWLGEMEGFIEGLIATNDYDYLGKDTKNPFYRYNPKPKYHNSSVDEINDIALKA